MERMIAALLAAVIAQPLDATYSTAGDPKNDGVVLTLKHPSSWVQFQPGILHAVKGLGDAPGTIACVVHIDAGAGKGFARGEYSNRAYRVALFEQRTVDSYVPNFAKIIRDGDATSDPSRPMRTIEYAGLDGPVAVHESIYAFFFEGRLIVVRVGCADKSGNADAVRAHFESNAAMFAGILASVTVQLEREGAPWAVIVVAVVCAAALVAVFIILRRRGRPSETRNRRVHASRR